MLFLKRLLCRDHFIRTTVKITRLADYPMLEASAECTKCGKKFRPFFHPDQYALMQRLSDARQWEVGQEEVIVDKIEFPSRQLAKLMR